MVRIWYVRQGRIRTWFETEEDARSYAEENPECEVGAWDFPTDARRLTQKLNWLEDD